MKRSVVLSLVFALALQEFPANAQGAAARDLSEARRKFAAAVRASDQALATARAAVESALANAAGSLGAEDQRARDALRTLKKGLTDFAAEKERILARDLGSPEQLLRAINDYERMIAAVAAIIVAVMVTIVAIVAVVAVPGGTALVMGAVVLVVVSAIVMLVLTILANLPALFQCVGEILRAMGFADAGDSLDSIGRWWDRNENSQPVRNAIKVSAAILQLVGEILRSALSAESGLRSAEAAARDAQARLQALPKAAPPPATPAGPDLAEARRKFAAAVHSSDQAAAAAEAVLDELIRQAAALTGGDHQQNLQTLRKGLLALRAFKEEKARILAQDLGTTTKVYVAARDYARACQVFAVSIAVTVAVIAIVVTIFTLGSDVAAAGATLSAIAGELAKLDASLTDLMMQIKVLQAAEEDEARRTKSAESQEEIRRNVQRAAAALADIQSAIASLHEASSATQAAQTRLRPAPKKPDLGQAPTTFDGDLGASFHVRLESGQVTRLAGRASLHGTVGITSASNPNVKLTLDGDATLTAGTGGAWVALSGHGTARLTGLGPALTIPNAAVGSQGVTALTLLGDGTALRGCTHSVEAGSLLAPSRATLAGSLRCGSWTIGSSTLTVDPNGLSGGGTFTAWSRSFAMSYAASGSGLSARGSLSGADTPWTRVAGFEAEYRIEGPKLELKLDGPALSPTFGAGKVNVRTIAKKPDGNPWSSASLTPDVVVVPAPPTDGIPVPLPALPAPSDAERAARDACEAGARRTLAGQALQHALDVCRSGHPSPPSVPSLPRSVSLKVGEVLR
ncbi:MAG: hypothetical protein IPL89_06255 [Acidobacteria bacterium]|nr:hypothetical protein [Acidobacteriota bacterium]